MEEDAGRVDRFSIRMGFVLTFSFSCGSEVDYLDIRHLRPHQERHIHRTLALIGIAMSCDTPEAKAQGRQVVRAMIRK